VLHNPEIVGKQSFPLLLLITKALEPEDHICDVSTPASLNILRHVRISVVVCELLSRFDEWCAMTDANCEQFKKT